MSDKTYYQTGGTAVGAGIGSFFGPAGTLVGGGLGGLAGGLVYDLFNGDDVQKAEQNKMAKMAQAASIYNAYRPQMQAAHQQGLLQQLQTMNGANNALRLMYGDKYDPRTFAPDMGKLPSANNADISAQLLAMQGKR